MNAPTTPNKTSRISPSPVWLTSLLPIKPATSPSTIQAIKDMAEPCCRLDINIPKVVRSITNITFSPSVKQFFPLSLGKNNGTRNRSLAWSRVSRVICLERIRRLVYCSRDSRSVRQHTNRKTARRIKDLRSRNVAHLIQLTHRVSLYMCVDAQTEPPT